MTVTVSRHADTLDLGRWCILRTSSADTIPLLDSLAGARFEVWTPVERRLAPSLSRDDDRRAPILPGFLFAAADRLPDLVALTVFPHRQHRRFRVFRFMDGFPLVSEQALAPLRREEDRLFQLYRNRKRRGRKGPVIEPGTEIAMPTGFGFDGLTATVIRQRGGSTFVTLAPFSTPIEVASVLLDDEAEESERKAA